MRSLVIDNIYESITSLKHDNSIEFNSEGYVLLRPHQIIPKYYLFTSDERHVLILHYATGSGKTITGLYCILDRLRTTKIKDIYRTLNVSKAIVIGEWFTSNQFRIDMSRPMFHLANPNSIEELKHLTGDEADALETKIYQSMNHIVSFYGYQAFFNYVFPLYAERHIQDVDILIRDWKAGKLVVNEQAIETLRNNIIIIDEMQRLYSQHGLNTFGFTFAYLARRAKELNLKLVYMSGTIFNSNISEIASIINITKTDGPFVSASDYCMTTKVLDDMLLYQLKPNIHETIIKHLYDKYIFYGRSDNPNERGRKGVLNDANMPIAKTLGATECIFIDNKKHHPDYPNEYIIGNTTINSNLTIFQIQASGFQLDGLKGIDIQEDEDEYRVSPFDAVLPPEREWRKYGISKDSNNLYDGAFLEYKNIGKFSCIAKTVVDLCKENAFNNEKTVLYHSKIMNFGLLQYGKILEKNGFVRRGNEPFENSICRRCRNTYAKHKNTCPHFEPMYFEFLQGQQRSSERTYITDQVYNSANNLYGELISVLLISDVAYAGVSLLSTNNLIILSRVPNMGRLIQIMARIVRYRSHIALENQIARFFVMGAAESINTKSSIYRYYKLRAMNEEQIVDFVGNLKGKTIGDILLNHPSKYKFAKDEKALASRLMFDDGREIIESIAHVVLKAINMNWWKLDRLIDRIRNNEIAISYLDLHMFPPEFIKRYLLDDNNLEIFTFDDKDNAYVKEEYGPFIRCKSEAPVINENHNRLYFEDIVNDYNDTIQDYIKSIINTTMVTSKRFSFMKLMDLLTLINDYSYIVNVDEIWDYIYDIGYEYYEGDEIDYIKNHSSKGRNSKKVAGVYWNKRVIMQDGSVRPIETKFVYTSPHPTLMKVMHLQADAGLRLIIFNTKKTVKEDQRSNQKGVDCWSRRSPELSSYYKIDAKNTLVYCSELATAICDEQLKNNKIKFMTTPFEKDLSI